MHILVFCHYYPPEVNAPASRTSEHARIWVSEGHEVTVVTCAPNHPRGKLYPGYRNKLFQSEIVDGVRVVRVWSWLAPNEGFVRRIANYLSYMATALMAVPRLPKPDVILSTSPQFFCGLAGMVARVMRPRASWVFEVRDLWPESIVSVGAMKKGPAIRFLELLESTAYRRADRIISVTEGFVPHIAERRGRGGISIVKNGVDLSIYKATTPEAVATFKARFGLEGRIVAAYIGTHGMAHGLDTVLEAAEMLKEDPRICFLLVGDGSERVKLQARAEKMNLPNLTIVGQMPKHDMPAIWSATDISLILLKNSDTFKTVLPSKMFEAMAMACPIILGVEGEARALLDEAGAGIGIEPENARELANAVMRLADDHELAARYGASGLAHVRSKFDRQVLARRCLKVFEDAVK